MADTNDHAPRVPTRHPSGARNWLLMRMNRWLLVGLIGAVAYLALVGADLLGLSPLRGIVARGDGLQTLFSTFVGAIITGTAIVVTINQLVLSQELGAVGDQRERMAASIAFRQEVEDLLEVETTPADPAPFLAALLEGVARTAARLLESVEADDHPEQTAAFEGYVDELATGARLAGSNLTGAEFGSFDVLWHALAFDYPRQLHAAHWLRARHRSTLSREAHDELEDLIELLAAFGPAREHIKTLYFQWTLIDLSRAMLYLLVPALVVTAAMVLYVDATALSGTTLGIDNLVWVTNAAVVVGMTPFIVFLAFILRIATVAKRTLAMGPFILQEAGGSGSD